MRLAVNQSDYIPWKGYFDIIRAADEFVLYDTAQFTKNDWRNRNRIKTASGLQWMTIPVKRHFGQAIREAQVAGPWSKKHWHALQTNYARAEYFIFYEEAIGSLYRELAEERNLSQINFRFLSMICGILGITTRIKWSDDCPLAKGKTERLVGLCQSAGADEYISGPAARNYIDRRQFDQAGIKVTFVDYDGYPEYPQKFGPFEHGVSILDLIFNAGPKACNYLKHFARSER
jgi:hypothetical protein